MRNPLPLLILGGTVLLHALAGCAQNARIPMKNDEVTTPKQSKTPSGWQPVPIVSAEIKAKGFNGGEGAQWVRGIAVDARDGNFMIWGTDVGGLFRSLDGGKSWEPCNVGYTPRGTAGVAIDPNNIRRVLSVGANSVAGDWHGLWLSEDGASSWRQVFKANISGSADNREQIAFDPQSYDSAAKMTRTVFWSRIKNDKAQWGKLEQHPALYKSSDGGRSWSELPASADLGGGIVRFHPRGRALYVGNDGGLHVSRDGGKTWKVTFSQPVTGLDVCRSAPDSVWLSAEKAVWVSRDGGATWKEIAGARVLARDKAPLRQVKVAPGDAKRLMLWRQGENWQWPRFYSHDGGATWSESKLDGSLQMLPTNARQGLFAFHPRDADVILSTGGDYPSLSRDGGKTFIWTGNGINNILVGGGFNFNARNPDVMFFGSQDYNGALTIDGGLTWEYKNPSGNGWGGFCYGGYAASRDVLFVGNAAGWGAPRELTVSRDGGQTWTKTGLNFAGPDVSYGDPTDARVVFASNYRSADGGLTWQPMAGCDAVYTSNPKGARRLYGKRWNKDAKTATLLQSSDKGASWTALATLAGNIEDIAFDPARNRVYVVSEDALKFWDGAAWKEVGAMPKDQWNGNRIRSVALDPTNLATVYAVGSRDLFASNASVLRSTDGGKTWTNLTLNVPLNGTNRDGGREAIWVRVHPSTREAWVSTSCYGLWKIAPPR